MPFELIFFQCVLFQMAVHVRLLRKLEIFMWVMYCTLPVQMSMDFITKKKYSIAFSCWAFHLRYHSSHRSWMKVYGYSYTTGKQFDRHFYFRYQGAKWERYKSIYLSFLIGMHRQKAISELFNVRLQLHTSSCVQFREQCMHAWASRHASASIYKTQKSIKRYTMYKTLLSIKRCNL